MATPDRLLLARNRVTRAPLRVRIGEPFHLPPDIKTPGLLDRLRSWKNPVSDRVDFVIDETSITGTILVGKVPDEGETKDQRVLAPVGDPGNAATIRHISLDGLSSDQAWWGGLRAGIVADGIWYDGAFDFTKGRDMVNRKNPDNTYGTDTISWYSHEQQAVGALPVGRDKFPTIRITLFEDTTTPQRPGYKPPIKRK